MLPTYPKPSLRLLEPPGPFVQSFNILPQAKIIPPECSADKKDALQLFHDALVVRSVVFQIEQKCDPDLEIDTEDDLSWHWIIYARNADGLEAPAATIRLVPAQAHADADDEKAVDGPNYAGSTLWDHKEPYGKFGRLATIKDFRGKGYGKILVDTLLEYAGKNADVMVKDKELGPWKGLMLIHAQRDKEGWYKQFGFETDEGMGLWWEEGIEHVGMWKRIKVVDC